MNFIIFSTDNVLIEDWIARFNIRNYSICYDIETLKEELLNFRKKKHTIVLVDYDSVSHDLNKLIVLKELPRFCVILEKKPAIKTGKFLVSHGIGAYGNTMMKNIHFQQLCETLMNFKVWTYPELTAALLKTDDVAIPEDSMSLLRERLSKKEIEVVRLILEGFVNDAIAKELGITTRTVKAHISSIFRKLHVNDRISLILLLR